MVAVRTGELPCLLCSIPQSGAALCQINEKPGLIYRTVEVALNAGAKVLRSAKGRARQMNHGAAAATGEQAWLALAVA